MFWEESQVNFTWSNCFLDDLQDLKRSLGCPMCQKIKMWIQMSWEKKLFNTWNLFIYMPNYFGFHWDFFKCKPLIKLFRLNWWYLCNKIKYGEIFIFNSLCNDLQKNKYHVHWVLVNTDGKRLTSHDLSPKSGEQNRTC